MDIGLGWLGVVVGLAGCLATFFMAAASVGPREAPRRTRLATSLTLLLTIILWAISMQRRPPFSEGQILGLGFLIGGITGAAAILLSSRLGSAQGRAKSLAAHSIAFLALLGVSLTYSIFHGNPQDALIGFSIGAAMAAILGYYTQESETAIHIETWALFGITLAVGVVLAVEHFNQSSMRMWWPLPILLSTTVCIARFVGTELAAARRSSHLLSALVAAVLVIGLSAIYSWRIVANWQLLQVVSLGIGVAAIAAWLGQQPPRRRETPRDAAARLQISAVLVLLVMAFVVISFKLWSGLGIALGLIAAWTLVLGNRSNGVMESWGTGNPTPQHSSTPVLLSLGLVILLFRLFIEEYRFALGRGDFRIHYTFVGAMLGVVIPFLLASSLMRLKGSEDAPDDRSRQGIGTHPPDDRSRQEIDAQTTPVVGGSRRSDTGLLASVGLIGLIAAATPILLYFIWGLTVVSGWMYGSTAAISFFLMMAGMECGSGASALDEKAEAPQTPLPHSIVLLLVGGMLVATQFIDPLSEVDLTRETRIWTLAVTSAVAILGLAITSIVSSLRER